MCARMYFHIVHQDVLYKSGALNDAMAKQDVVSKKRKADKQKKEAPQISHGVNTVGTKNPAKQARKAQPK
jgi:hypothetical protein